MENKSEIRIKEDRRKIKEIRIEYSERAKE